jgi:hypothetical protein
MKSEIRSILAPAQLELSFHRIGEIGAAQPFRNIIIVHFRGTCQSGLESSNGILIEPRLLEFPALRKTDISEGLILPYVQVYCNEVRAFMPNVSRTPYALIYGRALGRVVVHELYHALLSTRDHSRIGVARSAQSARDLTREKLTLDTQSLDRLRKLYGPKEKEGDSVEPPSEPGPTVTGLIRYLENQP